MPTFIKTGYWESAVKSYKGWLNLEELINSSGAVFGTGTAGRLAFWTAPSVQSATANLFWDAANNNLGIGTTAPIGKLDIVSDGGGQMFFTRYGGQPQINIRRSQGTFAAPTAVVSGASSVLNFGNYNGTAFATSAQIQVVPTTQTLTDAGATMALNVVRNGTTTMTNGLIVSGNNASAGAISITNGFNGPSARLTVWGSTINTTLDYFDIVNTGGGQLLRFFNTGNLVVGGSPDNGNRFQVYGDAFIKGSSNTAATNALSIQNNAGSSLFTIQNSGGVYCYGFFAVGANIVGQSTNLTIEPGSSGGRLILKSFPTTGSSIAINGTATFTHNTGQDVTSLLLNQDYAPVGGTGNQTYVRVNPIINQTSGATGITRGLYIVPTLTAATDWRAIEVSVGGAYFNTTSVAASAILQADSTTKGFLPPRMTTAQRTGISLPAAGLVVYDITDNRHYGYNGSTWNAFY